MSKEMNMRPDGLIWGKWKVDDRFYVLTNQWENFCYLLIGDEKALLLDAGYEWDGDLRAVVEEITDLPVMVVLTHGHLDHAGQIYWWDECWCGEGAEHDYEITVDPEQYASWKSKLGENFVWHILEDGEVIDIGGNEFEVIRVTAHAKSGLMLRSIPARCSFTAMMRSRRRKRSRTCSATPRASWSAPTSSTAFIPRTTASRSATTISATTTSSRSS